MTRMTPIGSEFPTSEEAEAHDAWFRAKVAMVMTSGVATFSHDSVMADARRIIDAIRDAADRFAH